jgi:hypothetical protein
MQKARRTLQGSQPEYGTLHTRTEVPGSRPTGHRIEIASQSWNNLTRIGNLALLLTVSYIWLAHRYAIVLDN